MKNLFLLLVGGLIALLSACTSPPPLTETASNTERGQEVALFAIGLIDTGYRFGGKNPEAGLDCSGMVSYIFSQAAHLSIKGSAADIARSGRPVMTGQLRPGDLVFFNTRQVSTSNTAEISHVGIYIGDKRFIHAPSSNGRVRIDSLAGRYYAQRLIAARTYFD